MRQHNITIKFMFALAIAVASQWAFAQSDTGLDRREFGLGQPQSISELPPGQLRKSLESLPPQAQAKGLRWLQGFSFPAADVEQLRSDAEGGIFYVEMAVTEEAGTASDTPTTYADVPQSTLDAAFNLHSKPGAPNVVFLDFDGANITNSAWGSFVAVPYNAAGDSDLYSFSNAELKKIIDIWHRVAEDLAPYDIDVTTEDPGTFNSRTGHVLITRHTDASGSAIYCTSCGGVAYVGVFGGSSYPYYSPALVFWDKLGSGFEHYVAEAASHEFGHNLGLSHDGRVFSDGSKEGYYRGHGSGVVSWAPIMGVGYYENVTQWSKGEYTDANNTQDDLAIIDGKLGYDVDDHGDSSATATALLVDANGNVLSSNPALDPYNELPENKGIIGSRDDVDVFWFTAGAGSVDLSIRPAWDAFYRSSNYRGANLDIEAELFDSSGASIAFSDPATETSASISTPVAAGTYYLAVTGVGNATVPYSDYASLGMYFIDGTVAAGEPDTTAPTPNPMGFASAPEAISENAITMTALTATDETSSVQYQFRCTAGGNGCSNSAWQSGTSYTATGLDAGTAYFFRVAARDLSGNENAPSAVASATTFTPPPPPAYTNYYTSGETLVAGTVSGVFSNTRDDDGAVQSITERESGGKPANRHSYLEHSWNFTIDAGDKVTVFANAWSSGSGDGDGFVFEYSINGGAFQTLFTVSSTDEGNLQQATISGSGSVVIRVTDTNQTPGNRELNTVYIDQLYIQVGNATSEPLNGGPEGLAVSAVSSSQIDLSWNNGSTNESGIKIERSTDQSNWTMAANLPAGSNAYSDTGLSAVTTYYYRVFAYKADESSGYATANATTLEAPAISLSASGFKEKGAHSVSLEWTGADTVEVFRDGASQGTHSGGAWTDPIGAKGGATYEHQVCVANTSDCSNVTTTVF